MFIFEEKLHYAEIFLISMLCCGIYTSFALKTAKNTALGSKAGFFGALNT